MPEIQSLCVYCGSSAGTLPEYAVAARTLGTALAARGIHLVYGGGNVGLMGIVADAVLQAGGQVFGVIPEPLKARELAHEALTELHIVEDMHQRKAKMLELSDGLITLPGGYGTLEELFEALSWSQLNIHPNPVGVLNVRGYFDRLLEFLDHAVTEGFLKPQYHAQLLVEQDVDRLIDRMTAYKPASRPPWRVTQN